VSKYADGLPLYRLEGILARYRIALSRTTMANSVIKLGDLVVPLINLDLPRFSGEPFALPFDLLGTWLRTLSG
jgi:transposase